MPDNENRLSLLSIEVLISRVAIDLKIECHLPCMVFRLLDYPAVSIPYFDQWQIDEFHAVKRENPHATWRELLSDQFYELRSANGTFNFKRGKSCLFKTYFKTLHGHLLNVPLFLLLIDQINNGGNNDSTTHFVGSGNVKLDELIETLQESIIKNGDDVPLVEQQTFHCALFNLMGTQIGACDVAIRFCHYGTTILTHLPMLDEGLVTKTEKKSEPVVTKQPVAEPVPAPAETIVKHIHFVNEKKDVALQLSRSDLPVSTNNKSAQTRWTSTKTRSVEHHHSKGHYLRTMDDPSLDDPSITFYRPPPLYFNSNADFLQMMTPVSDETKENRLAYLASIPIASFDDDQPPQQQRQQSPKPKARSTNNVRFDLSPTATVPVRQVAQQQKISKDFLQNFPLLRSLVEEALALQQSQPNRRVVFDERPHSAVPQGQRKIKPRPLRPSSARTKSVIVSRNQNARRLYPPPPETRQMVVTRSEVRDLVDRLSKPKFNKRIEREIAFAEQMLAIQEPIKTPRLPPPPTTAPPRSSSKTSTAKKPPLSYGTTRSHRLYTEFSRARRAAHEPPSTPSPRSKESPANGRTAPSPPQLLNTGTLSHFSLLNKVDIDSATMDKNSGQPPSSGPLPDKTGLNTKSSSTTSQDVTLELNQSSTTSTSTTTEPTLPERVRQSADLAFSITDVTDYFTDGGGSSTRPTTRQSN